MSRMRGTGSLARLSTLHWLRAFIFAAGATFASAALAQPTVAQPAFAQEDIVKGAAQYNRTCVQCHGRNMVNAGVTIYDLRRFPAEDPERFVASVTNGKGNMPSFKDALSPEQIQWLWAYVSSRGKPS
jgi:cytochrome c6